MIEVFSNSVRDSKREEAKNNRMTRNLDSNDGEKMSRHWNRDRNGGSSGLPVYRGTYS